MLVQLLGIFLSLNSVFAAPLSEPLPGVYVNSSGSPLLPLLKKAKSSIDIEVYTMADSTVRTLLRNALARGVRVRILKEPNPVGDKCKLFESTSGERASELKSAEALDCDDQRQLIDDVRSAGGVYDAFDKQDLCPNGGGTNGSACFEHGKIAIVDGVALISTGNFDSTNLCIDNPTTCNRDYSMIVEDSLIVSTLESLFEADLKAQPYDVRSLIPSSLSDVLTVSPYSEEPLLKLIRSARVSIELEAQYLKEPNMNAALVAQAKKGVQVSLTVASFCAFGRPSASATRKATATYSVFDKAGISTRMFNAKNKVNGKKGYMHAKAMIIDGKTAWVGSENGSTGSITQNREYGLIFDTASWVQTLATTMAQDHESPESETWRESLVCAHDK